MKKKNRITLDPAKRPTLILNLVAALLALAALVLLFLPYWTIDTGETYSINKYVWFPLDSTSFVNWLKTLPGILTGTTKADTEAFLNGFVGGPVLLLVLGVLDFFFCCKSAQKEWVSCLSCAEGIAGVVVFLTTPLLELGSNYVLFIILFAALAVVGIGGIYFFIKYLMAKRAKFLAYK